MSKKRENTVPKPENSPAMQRILSVLQTKGDMTAKEISESAYVSENSLVSAGYIRVLRNEKLIHISGWKKNCNGFTHAIYRYGPGEDCVRPRFTENDRDSLGLAKIESALKRLGPLSYREAALATGLSVYTIKNQKYMDVLVAQKRAHISGWRRNGRGAMTAIYEDGPGQNARQPKPFTCAEKSQRHRAKVRMIENSKSIGGMIANMSF